MKLLSRSDFDRRHTELIELQQHAHASHRSACFALETETGSEADVKKARAQIDLIAGKISSLASAFQESERLRGEQDSEEVRAAYQDLVSIVETGLAAREKATADLIRAGEMAGKALNEHDEATRAIRSAATGFVRRGAGSFGPAGHSRMSGINMSLERGASPQALFGAVLEINNVQASTLLAGRSVLGGATPRDAKDPLEIETDRSVHLRNHIALLDPTGETE